MLTALAVVSEPGSPARVNEDAAGAAGRFAWVIDGATGLADTPLLDAASDAAWLAAVLDEAFLEGAASAPDAADLLARAAAEAERRFVAERRRAPEHRYEIPTAAVLIVEATDDGLAVVELGDCAVYVAGPDEVRRIGGIEAGRMLEQESARRLMAGGRGRTAEVTEHLRAVRNRANAPDGYPIIAPDAASAAQARRHHVRSAAAEALLVTDGYDAAVDDYALFSPAGLVAAARADIGAPLAAARAVELADPACERFPRFKPSDDATAVLVLYTGAT